MRGLIALSWGAAFARTFRTVDAVRITIDVTMQQTALILKIYAVVWLLACLLLEVLGSYSIYQQAGFQAMWERWTSGHSPFNVVGFVAYVFWLSPALYAWCVASEIGSSQRTRGWVATRIALVSVLAALVGASFVVIAEDSGPEAEAVTERTLTALSANDDAGAAGPEVIPSYFDTTTEYYHVTDLDGWSTYIMIGDDARFFGRHREGVCVADVWSARELYYLYVRDRLQEVFSYVDLQQVDLSDIEIPSLEFTNAAPTSLLSVAFDVDSQPPNPDDVIVGRNSRWIYVETRLDGEYQHRFYVEDEIHETQRYETRIVLDVFCHRNIVTLEAEANSATIAPVDILGMPVGETITKPMSELPFASSLWTLCQELE